MYQKFVNVGFNIRAFSHPQIVKVYKMIQEDGLWGMVMEFIDGVDLNEYVDEYGQLSENDAILYIDQIGQALEYIHQQDGKKNLGCVWKILIISAVKTSAPLTSYG